MHLKKIDKSLTTFIMVFTSAGGWLIGLFFWGFMHDFAEPNKDTFICMLVFGFVFSIVGYLVLNLKTHIHNIKTRINNRRISKAAEARALIQKEKARIDEVFSFIKECKK